MGNQKFGSLNEQQQELLKSIDEDGQRLLTITSELLNLSQVESGNIRLNVESCNPEELVYTAVKNVEMLAEQKNISVITEIKTNKEDRVVADFDKTVWVINNFLSNAIKHSFPEESIRILIEKKVHLYGSGFLIAEKELTKNTTAKYLTVIFRFLENIKAEQVWDWQYPRILLKNNMVKSVYLVP